MNKNFLFLKNLIFFHLREKYFGSYFGILWLFISPMIMMLLFSFIFLFVFQTRLPGFEYDKFSFTIWLLCGYVPWLFISESISNSTNSLSTNAVLLKNINIKISLVPLASVISSIVPLLIGLIIILLLISFSTLTISYNVFFFIPIYIMIGIVLFTGIGYYLSFLNTFFNDVSIALPQILLIILFASPIFYPIDVYPESVRGILKYNPIYIYCEFFRDLLIYKKSVNLLKISFFSLFSFSIFITGSVIINKYKTSLLSRL